ncbi:DUF4041 domain-containing protein [Sulfurimonas sp.]|uniref:DUF4041 domain-containing protein n=1 Tax=Sulfurimonas sp. TaxID=2022749 RepID=UPI0025F7BF51|nr:DUF4041 domain-containing protein [Sulfurimonas sp.]MDD5156464.1 DUF4041 domain-containing protein [Sulfurimonas sp.]
METKIFIVLALLVVVAIMVFLFERNKNTNEKISYFNSIDDAIAELELEVKLKNEEISRFDSKLKMKQLSLETIDDDIQNKSVEAKKISDEIAIAKASFDGLSKETADLQRLKTQEEQLRQSIQASNEKMEKDAAKIASLTAEIKNITRKADLYSRIDEFIDYGHFEIPQYLYETSARYAEEIKIIRNTQKKMIMDKKAVLFPERNTISKYTSLDSGIFKNQIIMMLKTFNIECDFLIENVSPGNFARTLERISKAANDIEKNSLTLEFGFNNEYILLKLEECELQYQFALKKQEEKEEQRFIREQMREEQKAMQEAEKAIQEAEKEEHLYRELLSKAREELAKAGGEEIILAEFKIAELERKLEEAENKECRAKSMAEQTRRGHVYIISNIGSFGENVYKIGMTRRLDPMDRVKELGDASVPFRFDVHAMIAFDDAPKLESELHKKFMNSRVNAVNLRKEFFKVDLEMIRAAVAELTNKEADFITTILAEEYFETKRLQVQPVSLSSFPTLQLGNTYSNPSLIDV